MTETEYNEGVSTILDSPKTAIRTQKGLLTLRDVLTAVFDAQQTDTRWVSKLFGKKKQRPEAVILYLPNKIGEYINLSEGGRYLGFFNQIVDSLDLLTKLDLLTVAPTWSITETDDEVLVIPYYGVTSLGKSFVKYHENKKA